MKRNLRILLANFTKMTGDTGGTAKVNCAFANEMVRRGHEVAMVYSDDREGDCFFRVSEKVLCYNLRHYEGKHQTMPLPYIVWREILRVFSRARANAINDVFTECALLPNVRKILYDFCPDVILCFQPAAAKTYVLDLNVPVPVILMGHGDVADWFVNYPSAQVEAIGKCDLCQVLMPSFARVLQERFPKLSTTVIGNVVPQYEIKADLSAPKERRKVLFLGRLAKGQKRPHLLVEAFCRLARDFPDWDLELWGATDRKSYNQEMDEIAVGAGLSDRVRQMGVTKKVPEVLATGDIFVFPSASEGFGLAVAEAMCVGLPVVAYRSCPALNELIEDGATGFLSGDGVDALANIMARLMGDMDLRVRIGAAAREAMRAYAPETIWNEWERLLEDAVDKGTKRRTATKIQLRGCYIFGNKRA